MATPLTDGNFKTELAGKTVLVDFWAEWCAPCKQMEPVLEQVASTLTDIQIRKLNIDENPQTPASLGISSIPTLILFKDGAEVDRKVGLTNADNLTTWIKQA